MNAAVQPSRPEFHRLAADHTVVPVWRELLADLVTPVAAFARLVGDEPGFLLESVEHGERWSRWSFVGRNPLATLTSKHGSLTVEGELHPDVPTDQGILAAVEALLARHRSPQLADLPPLHGGLVGYLGYDVVREVERLPDVPPDDRGHPDAVLSIIGQLAAFDHWRQRVTLIDNVLVEAGAGEAALDAAYDAAIERLDQLAADGARPLDEPLLSPPRPDDEPPAVTSSMAEGQYQAAVEVAREHVFAGDVFQVVLSQRFDFPLEAEPFDAYRALRQVNPSPYMYFLRVPGVTLVGASPEPMVQLLDGRVISRPIAGTRKRGRSEAHDRRLAAELVEH
ncbi:MAG TPA: chorismate-binding protein, partial [Acidimicrobiales bacterium]